MLQTYRLLDVDAVDEWVRSVQSALAALSSKDDAPFDCEYLGDRCSDTLRYDPEQKYRSLLYLIDQLESFLVEFPGLLAADITARARSLIRDAERRRFLN